MDSASLMGVFDEVWRAHELIPADAFNDDIVYKQNLNQVYTALSRANFRETSIWKTK